MAQHNIAVVWDGDRKVSGAGVFKDGQTTVAGPGEKFRTDHETAERLVREGKAHYPRH